MAQFDTVIIPTQVTPSNTSNTTLYTGLSDTEVLLDIAVIGGSAVDVQWGVTPSGGSVHWKGFGVTVTPQNPLVGLGPYMLRVGDAITVRTASANDVTFSVTGARTT